MTTATLIIMPPKFPDESLDYSVDFLDRLLAGEGISNKAVTVVRGSAVASNVAVAGSAVTWWLAGGVALEDTLLKVSATTNSIPPRTHEVLVRVKIASPGV